MLKRMQLLMFFPASLLFNFLSIASAQTFVGTFVAVKGDVKVLREPISNEDQKGPFAIYESKQYVYSPAKIGLKIKAQEIIQTGTDGKAKITYPNGDHMVLAPGSSVAMPTPLEGANKDKKTKLNLFYGKIRALISKKGPLKNMQITTPSAVAGVRGTDFVIGFNGQEGSQLTVLRGSVAFKADLQTVATKDTLVKSGFTAELPFAPQTTEQIKEPTVAVKATTKEALVDIQSNSSIKPSEEELKQLPESVKKEIEQLKVKSTEALVDDIKTSDPQLFEKIKKEKISDTNEINAAVVSALYKAAPAAKPKSKPSREEIEGMGEDVYKKYFREDN